MKSTPRCKICRKRFKVVYFNQKACLGECNKEYLKQNPPKEINNRSDKRTKEERVYEKEKKIHKANHPICECGCGKYTTEIHHKAGRIGKLIYDVRYFMAMHWECHKWVHLNPKQSRKKGWLITIN